MANIGRIPVPAIGAVGQFPLRTDFAHGRTQARAFVAHQFADGTEQRFYVGDPGPRYTFVRRTLGTANRALLAAFWQSTQGCVGAFTYDVPQENGAFVPTTVCFENQPLTLEDLVAAITSVGITFVGLPDPDSAPSYEVAAAVTRFPDAALADALLDEVQEIIPLVRIRVLDADVPDIFLSDRLVTVGGQEYQPRLLRVGEQGGDVLIEQTIDGSTDDVQFTFGNADRAMIRLANDTDLINARIELSLFHVGSGYRLNLWAGLVVAWASDTGPEFTVRGSDVLSALTILSPVGVCSRTCWRRYSKDGCPATSGTQALDLAHFPNADARWCDQGYNTENGCLAHSGGDNPTKYSFGAIWIENQTVKILDNSTGLWGIARQGITPTSQINDSLWGQSLPEIWHDDDGMPQRGLPAPCRIVAGRDESEFYIALGVVGRGPLGAYTPAQMVDEDGDGKKETLIASTLDGQAHHGFAVDENGDPTPESNDYGLRQVLGSDPAGANDFFSVGRVGDTPANWREVVGGESVYEDTYAAEVAFVEIRRTDEAGIQLSTPDSHTMVALISKGLTAKVWTAPGARGDQPGCTNPFWVAINTFLRAIALAGADAATQEAAFDVDAAIAAAAEAEVVVPSIFDTTLVPNEAPEPTTDSYFVPDTPQSVFVIGGPAISLPRVSINGGSDWLDPADYTWDGNQTITLDVAVSNCNVWITYPYCDGTYTAVHGNEKQFRFKGTVDAAKPTRDWLRDILNNALGYFTWSFGKLRVGCRNNATPVSWFQQGNILFNSLRLEPIRPGFEKLTVTFGDEQYQFAKNCVSHADQDYAAKHRRVANPRESQLGLVGSSTKSQSMRIAVSRTREELGGVGDAEQTAARAASWRSTIMALDVEAGEVAGVVDPELNAGNGAAFRVRSWRLNRDWSVDLAGATVTPSMYDVTTMLTKPGYSELLTAGANNEIVFVGTDVIRVILS